MPDQMELQGIKDPIGGQSQITPLHDLYTTFNIGPPVIQDFDENPFKQKTVMNDMLKGTLRDPLNKDVSPIQTSIESVDPFLANEDGINKYGYSDFLNGGDNEDRYAQNFKKDNPHLFWRDGFHPWEGVQKGIYWGGGFLEKTLESAVVKTGQGLAGLFQMANPINFAISASDSSEPFTFSKWLQDSQDGILSNIFDGWDNNLKSRYDYFQEANDRNHKGFIAALSDGDFWMNDISDGLSFLTSAMFEVGLISKLGLGARVANRLAPLAAEVPTAAIEGAEFARNASRATKFLNGIGFKGSGNLLLKNAVDLTAQTLGTTTIESAVEANEVRKSIYESLDGKINPSTSLLYTDDEKKKLAAEGAANVFSQNMITLIGPNFLQTLVFNRLGAAFKKKLFKGGEGEGSQGANLSSKGKGISEGVKINRISALKRAGQYGSAALIGFGSEGLWEENMQLAISRQAESLFGDNEYSDYDPGTTREAVRKLNKADDFFGTVGSRYLNQTRQFFKGIFDDRFVDDELSKSIGLGGLFGVVGGAAHIAADQFSKTKAKINSYWEDVINKRTTSLFEATNFFVEEQVPDPKDATKTIPKVYINPATGKPMLDKDKVRGFFAANANLEELQKIISATEVQGESDPQSLKALNRTAKLSLFAQLADEYSRAGKKGLLLDQIKSIQNFTDQEITALGFEPGEMSMQDKADMLKQLSYIVESQAAKNDWIDNNVLDNVRDKKQGKFGVFYTKQQKADRQENFEKKKAYLRKLGTQRILLDAHVNYLLEENQKLGQSVDEYITSSVLDSMGKLIKNPDGTLNLDPQMADKVQDHILHRMTAINNTIKALEDELAIHFDSVKQTERFSRGTRTYSTEDEFKNKVRRNIAAGQAKIDETMEKLQDLDEMTKNHVYTLEELEKNNPELEKVSGVTGGLSIDIKTRRSDIGLTLEELDRRKKADINSVVIEEMRLQKGWVVKEWQEVAALKEEKLKQELTKFVGDRMRFSNNTYNKYFEREVLSRDTLPGSSRLKLFNSDPTKRVNAKKYKENEEKLLKAVRIQGKVLKIVSESNGEKLMAEIEALVAQELESDQFEVALIDIIKRYNGKPIVIDSAAKSIINSQIDYVEDEYAFVNDMLEYLPEDDRFNNKYYDIDENGSYFVKDQFDSPQAVAQVSKDLRDTVDNFKNLKLFLDKIPTSVEGDWENLDVVKKRIADVYTDTSDSIIENYNNLSNNGTSDVAGDSLSSKQDLDLINNEIDELGQLKEIFNERNITDHILNTTPFTDYISLLDKRIEDLKKIREIVQERMSSRLRENKDFLIDAANSLAQQLGLNFDGTVSNSAIYNAIETEVSSQILSKLATTLTDLKSLIDKPDQTAEDKKAIEDAYWTVNGQVSAIQQLLKTKGEVTQVHVEVFSQKNKLIEDLKSTNLGKLLGQRDIFKSVFENIGDSVLGALQTVFYSSNFTKVGRGNEEGFIDDLPSSPVYKFRETYNLSKLIRDLEKDNSRTPANSEVSKEDLLEFLTIAKKIQNLQDFGYNLESKLNMLDQIEREKEIVQAKIAATDNAYEGLIIPSIQQLFFIRSVASFLNRKTVSQNEIGFRNWLFIQAPGGAGKTQTLGTWFNRISNISTDRVLATAFTEEAAKGIKKALRIDQGGPKDIDETIAFMKDLVDNKKYDYDVLIIDEFPAITVNKQKELFDLVSAYTKAKLDQDNVEFKVITLGDTNQLTFDNTNTILPHSDFITNPGTFGKGNHIAKMTIVPSLTVNFRSNLFPITFFIDQFKGSNKPLVNADVKVVSTDSSLLSKNVKGVVAINKSSFGAMMVNYLKLNEQSPRTRALIVNESKIDTYKKLLTDNGIKIVTDPNDELTKGVYVTSVRNVQGFSFDEVFVDLESNDKSLFSTGTASPDYNYNKAMYVAASRARSLIVVTNFPNFQNTEDPSIETLENKALSELQTKDDQFVVERDLEINGAKSIIGDDYTKTVKSAVQAKTEDENESTLDTGDTENDTEEVQEEETEEILVNTPEQEIVSEEEQEQSEEAPEAEVDQRVETTPGVEDTLGEEEETKNLNEYWKGIYDKVRDTAVSAFFKLKKGVINSLYPTSSSIKYKISDGVFTAKTPADFEYNSLKDGDAISLIPFEQSQGTNSKMNFGYAIVTTAKDAANNEVPNTYRTISILSDKEIENLKTSDPNLFKEISDNEQRIKGAVSITYADVSNTDGFVTNSGKIVNVLKEGKVVHSNPIKYFRKPGYMTLSKMEFDLAIHKFINSFYKNYLDSFDSAQRATELTKIKDFYKNHENAQIVIPTQEDISKKRFKIPTDFQLNPGRPYIAFQPYMQRSTMQFVPLSRKFLSTDHSEYTQPIKEFIELAKTVRAMLKNKGIDSKLGYSKSLSNFISKVANEFSKNPSPDGNQYSFKFIQGSGNTRVTKDITLSLVEAERIYNLYSMYSVPSTEYIELTTPAEIKNIIQDEKGKKRTQRARSYNFADGETVYGVIEDFDSSNNTFTVKDIKTKEVTTHSGVIRFSGKNKIGIAQEALNEIFTSNGNISSKFTSVTGQTGFVTNKATTVSGTTNKGYDFMALLGSKTAPVAKTFDSKGDPKEFYDDVIDILENLFNFAKNGELPGKNLTYLDADKKSHTVEAKFRVPVKINKKDENGQVEHNYSSSTQNTSRSNAINNAKYFESNFDDLVPTQLFVTFGEKGQEKRAENKNESEAAPENKEIISDVDYNNFIDKGKISQDIIKTIADKVKNQKPLTQRELEIFTDKTSEINKIISEEKKEVPKDTLKFMSFMQIVESLTPIQYKTLATSVAKEGYTSINEFIDSFANAHPEEQAELKDYLINCIV